jgi:hypothetical protein
VTGDPNNTHNTLTHRIQGPTPTATIELNYATMTKALTMDGSWNTTGTGREVAGATISGGRIRLQANADIRPGAGRQARFSYSMDGVSFGAVTINRFAITAPRPRGNDRKHSSSGHRAPRPSAPARRWPCPR